jgi:hypothetical protein
MKEKKSFSLLTGIIFSTLALAFLMNTLSTPLIAQAQGRFTPTSTRTHRPTKTDVPPPTSTPTETPVPSKTSTPAPTKKLPAPTNTPTPTATVTATAIPRSVRLNELLPRAEFKDWNKDKVEDANDQWIELFNLDDKPADVSNWIIDTGDQTPTFILPPGSTIPAGGFLLLFRTDTLLNLDSYGHLRLIHPDGLVADEVLYPPLESDRVYARAQNGTGLWRTRCVPTPLTSNCQAEETITSQFDLPYFERNITVPTRSLDVKVLVTNILLALTLALAIGFFSNLLNDAIESHEQDFAILFGPVTRAMNRMREAARSINRIISRSRIAWLGFPLKFLFILLVYGTILAYLDPDFRFITQDSFMLIAALGLSTGFIALADDLATYIYLRTRGASGEIRFHSGNFLLVILSTFVSRVTGLVPGLFLGSPAGIQDVPDEHAGAHLDILAIITTAILGFAAWALLPAFQSDPWLKTLLLLMFAAGVQSVFFEMLPVSYLRGKGIFKFSRVLWLILFAVAAAVFLQTMLNPNGAFLSAFQSTNMILLSLFVLGYCVLCLLIWFSLTRLARKRELEKVSTD